jgi:hypothetical protein
MMAAIVLSIILHAQTVVPVLGSTQGSTAVVAPIYTPLILKPGTAVIERPGTALVLFK